MGSGDSSDNRDLLLDETRETRSGLSCLSIERAHDLLDDRGDLDVLVLHLDDETVVEGETIRKDQNLGLKHPRHRHWHLWVGQKVSDAATRSKSDVSFID